MGYELRYIWEARRLVWLIGLAFAVIIMFQYFELPYGDVISSLFSAGKAQVPGIGSFPTGDPSQNPMRFGNMTHFDGSNFTGTNDVHEGSNETLPEEKDVGLGIDFESARDGDSDDFTELDENGDPEDESSTEKFDLKHNSTMEKVEGHEGSALQQAKESDGGFSIDDVTTDNTTSLGSSSGAITSPSPSPLLKKGPAMSLNPNTSSLDKDEPNSLHNDKKPGTLRSNLIPSDNSSSNTEFPRVKESHERPMGEVVSISDMNNIFIQIRASSHSMRPRWSSTVDQELLNAKSQIKIAPINENDRGLYAPLYRNISMFRRSYELMERTLKVYIYKEGSRPIFHQPVLKGIYASEGWFMKLLKANRQFVTKSPKKAHLFYMPFSSRMLEETLYVPNSHSHKNLIQYLKNYLDMIMVRYPFWNRTGGADHFLVACHDWAPSETRRYMSNCIRALCNSDIREGFKLGNDVSLPETLVRSPQNPLRELGGKPPSQRPILAFFAGSNHGYLRPILLKHWENKDPDMKIFGKLPKSKGNRNYVQYMKSSKYCICAKGYEVNSPRVVEAIFYDCVPVIISDNFVPPFFEVLNWESFAVFVEEKDIPNLKKILLAITERRYRVMHQGVKQVQQHFLWHVRPVKYDIFHMILHSIWYNRVFQISLR